MVGRGIATKVNRTANRPLYCDGINSKNSIAGVRAVKELYRPPVALAASPGLLINVALPAVALLKNRVMPPVENVPKLEPLFVKVVALPAVALPVNCMMPRFPAPSTSVTKFWGRRAIRYSIVLRAKPKVGLIGIVQALAPAPNVMPFALILPKAK